MGDCLHQPWGNLGISLVMQKRFDEAETAYKRALEVDPQYQRAKEHLTTLEYLRAHPDETPDFSINSPFQGIQSGVQFTRS